jgi:hypothetical protein
VTVLAVLEHSDALAIESLLAKYHEEVWDTAQSDNPDYDYAGRETAKELVASIHRIIDERDKAKAKLPTMPQVAITSWQRCNVV